MKRIIKKIRLFIVGLCLLVPVMQAKNPACNDVLEKAILRLTQLKIDQENTASSATNVKEAISSIAQQINPNDVKKYLKDALSEFIKMAGFKLSPQEVLYIHRFMRENKDLIEKIPTIIIAIIIEFTDAIVQLLNDEQSLDNNSLYTEYQSIKNQIIGHVDTLFSTKTISAPKQTHEIKSNNKNDIHVNKLLEACNSDIITPLIIIFGINKIIENTDLLDKKSSLLNPDLLAPKFNETAKKVLIKNLKPHEMERLTGFFVSPTWKNVVNILRSYFKALAEYIPNKIVAIVNAVKNWTFNKTQQNTISETKISHAAAAAA